MAIDLPPMRTDTNPIGTIFLSGSIPDPTRWEGEFDPLEITDAVVTFARACLTENFRIVTAAHPTLAPLLLYVAAEFPPSAEPLVLIYQSLLFDNVLPTATRRFEAAGVGTLVWTEAHEGDHPEPGKWESSLEIMRAQMLEEADPDGAVFIGGMEGIRTEYALFGDRFPGRPMCAIKRPGGEAARLSDLEMRSGLVGLKQDATYPTLWRDFIRSVRDIDLESGNS